MNKPKLEYLASKVLKFCPFCGSKNFISKSEKQFQCNNCGSPFFFNVAAATAAIICNSEGKVLFTRRKYDPMKGTLDLPGGFVDSGENVESALKREIKEELNIDIPQLSYFGSFPNKYTYKGLTYYTLDFVFVCKVDSFNNLQANDDVSSIEFVDLINIDINKIGLQSIRNVIQNFLNMKNFIE